MAATAPSLKLTWEGASRIVRATVAKATEIGVPECNSVVDTGGHLLAFARTDSAFVQSIDSSLSRR